jgi:hypothetical protein
MFTQLLHLLLALLLKSGTAAEQKNRVFFELSGLFAFAAILRPCGNSMKTACDVLEPFPSRRENAMTSRENNEQDLAMRKKLGKNSARKPP